MAKNYPSQVNSLDFHGQSTIDPGFRSELDIAKHALNASEPFREARASRDFHRRVLLLRVTRQVQTQLTCGPNQTGLDGSLGNVQNLAYGAQFHSLKVLHVEYHALLRCQVSQCT